MRPELDDAAAIAEGLDPAAVERIVTTALDEDLGGPDGVDVTSVATIPDDQTDVGDLVARADGVVAGLAVAAAVFAQADPRTTVDIRVNDGARVARGDRLATVSGPTRALLTAERTALNLLCRMSGVATHTRKWADRAGRHRRDRAGHPQDHARPADPGEVRGPGRRWHQQAHGSLRRRDDQGQPQAGGRVDHRGLPAGPGPTSRTCRCRSRWRPWPRRWKRSTPAPTSCCSTTWRRTLLREVVAAVGGRAELEATGDLTLEVARDVRRDRRGLPVGRRPDALVADPGHRAGPARGDVRFTRAALHRHRKHQHRARHVRRRQDRALAGGSRPMPARPPTSSA